MSLEAAHSLSESSRDRGGIHPSYFGVRAGLWEGCVLFWTAAINILGFLLPDPLVALQGTPHLCITQQPGE